MKISTHNLSSISQTGLAGFSIISCDPAQLRTSDSNNLLAARPRPPPSLISNHWGQFGFRPHESERVGIELRQTHQSLMLVVLSVWCLGSLIVKQFFFPERDPIPSLLIKTRLVLSWFWNHVFLVLAVTTGSKVCVAFLFEVGEGKLRHPGTAFKSCGRVGELGGG